MGVLLAKQNAESNQQNKRERAMMELLSSSKSIPDYLKDWGNIRSTKICTLGSDEDILKGELPQLPPHLPYVLPGGASFFDVGTEACYWSRKGKMLKLTMLLRKHGPVILEYKDGDGYRTPLHHAVEKGRSKTVYLLLKFGAKLEARDAVGWTPLLTAAFHGQVEIMVKLLEAGAQVDVRDNEGNGILALIASSPRIMLQDLLSTEEKKQRRRFRLGPTGKHIVASAANMQDISPDDPDAEPFECPLPDADWKAYPNLFEVICMNAVLPHKPPIDARDNKGVTPLMYAARYGRLLVVSRLISARAKLELMDREGRTALVHAVEMANLLEIRLLLEAKANVNTCDARFRTPLHVALSTPAFKVKYNPAEDVQGPLLRCVSTLLETQANVNVFDLKGRTPLLLAMETGEKQLFSLILDRRPTLEIVDSNGWNVGIYATRNGMLGDLLHTIKSQRELQRRAVFFQDKQGLTALHHAILCQHQTEVEFCVNIGGADLVTIPDINGDTSLHLAASLGLKDSLSRLVDELNDVDLENDYGETPLLRAAMCGHLGCFTYLLSNVYQIIPADSESVDNKGQNLLMLACISGNLDLVNAILACVQQPSRYLAIGKIKVNASDNEGLRAVHHAVKEGHFHLLPSLVQAGASLSPVDKDGWTPLHYAAAEGDSDTVSALLDLANGPEIIEKGDKDGFTPLLLAVCGRHAPAVQTLLDRRADTETTTNAGVTPLVAAIKSGSSTIQEIVLDSIRERPNLSELSGRSKINMEGHWQLTLHYATELLFPGLTSRTTHVYAYISYFDADSGVVEGSWSSCALATSDPVWHETFRFDMVTLTNATWICVQLFAVANPKALEIYHDVQVDKWKLKLSLERPKSLYNPLLIRDLAESLVPGKALGGSSKDSATDFRLRQVEEEERFLIEEIERAHDRSMACKKPNKAIECKRVLRQFFNLEIPDPPINDHLRRFHIPVGLYVFPSGRLFRATLRDEPLILDRQLRGCFRGRICVELDWCPKLFKVIPPQLELAKEKADILNLVRLRYLNPSPTSPLLQEKDEATLRQLALSRSNTPRAADINALDLPGIVEVKKKPLPAYALETPAAIEGDRENEEEGKGKKQPAPINGQTLAQQVMDSNLI